MLKAFGGQLLRVATFLDELSFERADLLVGRIGRIGRISPPPP